MKNILPNTRSNKMPAAERRSFSHRHAILVAGLLIGGFLGLMTLPSQDVEAKRTLIPLDLPGTTDAVLDAPLPLADDALTEPIEWQRITVRRGDSLYQIFKRAELPPNALPQVLEAGQEARRLQRIHPGDTLSYQTGPDGQLLALRYDPAPLTSLVFNRQTDGRFAAEIIEHTPEVRLVHRQAGINSSLFAAGQSLGLSQNLLMEFADIFSGVVDFALDVRKGDRFGLVYEERYLDGEYLGNGRILAAYFTNQGDTHTAYYYQDGDQQGGYYNESGASMRKAFLRAPLDFTRVSSNFNPARLHPVFKTVRPHNGIDYAAPTGTPVYAAGDGRVIESGYSQANGNYVIIQHGSKYTTKYLHLHKRTVQTGQRVSQRQLIGQVGATGYATGPHLHYEFLVNGVHRNPRTIASALPQARVLADAEKQRFLAATDGLRLQLATLRSDALQLAGSAMPDGTL